jgi:beta-galactosidase
MRKIILSVALCSAIVASASAPIAGFNYNRAVLAPDGTEWQDCENLALNKEQPHAYFFPFSSVETARQVLPQHSPYYKSLDGIWKFNWVKTPELRPTDFYRTDFDVSQWDTIAVPGCWNVQGLQKDGSQKYGTPIYVNQPVPFMHEVKVGDWKNGVMRTPPKDWTMYEAHNEVGSYRRTFSVPADWDGSEVYINFDGVDSFFYLWVNGQYVGFSKNSRNTASFNITDKLVKGENVVAVEVYRNSDGSFLESQDMFRLPGIIRSTYLTATPKVQIQDLVVRTELPGTVKTIATVRNLSKNDAKNYRITYSVFPVELYSDATADVATVTAATTKFSVGKGEQTVDVNHDFTIESPKLWSAEEPNRYVLVAELRDKKDKVVETVSTYFGVRQVEIRETAAADDEFGLAGRYYYINNKPVKLKGVNRHENNLATGHVITHEQIEHEVMLMKQGNINHVRNSHYSNDPFWYITCDKYGIYLEDEANIESHEYYYGDESLSHVPEWRNAHVARNLELVHSHVNHPSVVIWSLGNEAGPGNNFVEAYNAIKEFDTSRPVQYERNNDIVDMGSNQYPSIPWVRSAVKGVPGIKYPFHISEYAHSMGNAVGNLVDYWEAIESTNFFCGGAIWDWVDQALWNYTPDGTQYMGYGGDFGDKPNNGMFCMNGIMFPDFSPKPQFTEVKKVYQNVGVQAVDMTKGVIEVFNKNYFTTLDDYDIHWSLTRDGVEVQSGKAVNRPRMSVEPRTGQTWSVPYKYAELDSLGEYYLTVQFVLNTDKPWAKKGYVQMEEQLPVTTHGEYPAINATKGKALNFAQHDNETTVEGKDWTVKFNDQTGTINSLIYGNTMIITPGNGPKLSALRAPVDNDVWTHSNWFANGLHNLRHKATARKAFVRQSDGAVVISYTVESQAPCASSIRGGGLQGNYEITDGREFTDSDFKFTTEQVWTIYPDGSIELESSINSNKPSLILPRLGYEMTLPTELSNYTYYGRGPVNNFNDRETGSFVGVYTSTVADQFVNFPKPQSMGNREDVRWASLTNSIGNGVQFIATTRMSTSALPWSDLELTLAPHPYQLPESKGTTLHLDAKVLGLGGASCGQGGPLVEDRVFADAQTFGFIIRPVTESTVLAKNAKVVAAGAVPISATRNKVGDVTLSCADTTAVIKYTVSPLKGSGTSAAKTFTDAFNLREGGVVTAWLASAPQLTSKFTFARIDNIPVEVIYTSAEEPNEGEAAHLVDGDISTIWHTTYGVTVAQYPHWVDFDCGMVKNVKGFTYLPRQDGWNGDIKDWRIEVSLDGETWTKADEGSFQANKAEKRVEFKPVKARYVRFTALSSQYGEDFASGAEFSILAE